MSDIQAKLLHNIADEIKDDEEIPTLKEYIENEHRPLLDSKEIIDSLGNKIMDFYTDYGTQRVTIDGDISSGKPIIITYHDVGINHNACFMSFINMIREYDEKFKYFTIVHIDAPQHHYNDSTVKTNDNIDHFDLLELATQIEEIRSKLCIDRFIGFGVGASCNIWTYYGINYCKRLRGLILLNGIGSGPSWKEWIFDTMLSTIGTNSQWLIDSLRSSLLIRYFPRLVSQETYDYFLDEFDKLDTQSIIKYFRGFIRRKEFNQKQLNKIKTKVLIICGENSKVKDETINFQKIMPAAYRTFVLMNDTGFLLTESHPQKICSSIDLFVQSLGLTKISLKSKFGQINKSQTI
eukprot:448062_1